MTCPRRGPCERPCLRASQTRAADADRAAQVREHRAAGGQGATEGRGSARRPASLYGSRNTVADAGCCIQCGPKRRCIGPTASCDWSTPGTAAANGCARSPTWTKPLPVIWRIVSANWRPTRNARCCPAPVSCGMSLPASARCSVIRPTSPLRSRSMKCGCQPINDARLSWRRSELVSNALLHAFQGRMAGLIEVRLAASGPKSARLRVADNGIGFTELGAQSRSRGGRRTRWPVGGGSHLRSDGGLDYRRDRLSSPWILAWSLVGILIVRIRKTRAIWQDNNRRR